MERLINSLDHVEIVNWIQYMSFPAASIGKTTVNLDNRNYIELPSGKKVKITIMVEELE